VGCLRGVITRYSEVSYPVTGYSGAWDVPGGGNTFMAPYLTIIPEVSAALVNFSLSNLGQPLFRICRMSVGPVHLLEPMCLVAGRPNQASPPLGVPLVGADLGCAVAAGRVLRLDSGCLGSVNSWPIWLGLALSSGRNQPGGCPPFGGGSPTGQRSPLGACTFHCRARCIFGGGGVCGGPAP